MAGSLAPYIHVILSYIVSITMYYSAISKTMMLQITSLSVSMTSFASDNTVQLSDTIPSWNVQLKHGIHLTLILLQQVGHFFSYMNSYHVQFSWLHIISKLPGLIVVFTYIVLSKPLVSVTTVDYQSAVSMISLAQVTTAL